jgi:hypothetical protein
MAKLYRMQLAVLFTAQDNVAEKCEYSVTTAAHSGRCSACGMGVTTGVVSLIEAVVATVLRR